MFGKINIYSIIKDHISTLKAYRSDNISIADLFIFYITPFFIIFILSLVLNLDVLVGQIICSKDFAVTSISIFTGFLFNVLILIYDVSLRLKTKKQITLPDDIINLSLDLLMELYYNISYEILVSLIVVFSYLLLVMLPAYSKLIAVVISYLVIHLGLTLLMILKRTHILIKNTMAKI